MDRKTHAHKHVASWLHNWEMNTMLNVPILGMQYSSGGRLNKKDGLTRYGNSHVQDKTS